jgi:hypothetical protein
VGTQGVGGDGVPLMPGNNYVPLVSNLKFDNITVKGEPACVSSELAMIERACMKCNTSKCYNTVFIGERSEKCHPSPPPPRHHMPPQTFACKRTAKTLFGEITLPWGVCLPLDAPVNIDRNYPNWGAAKGSYASLTACKAACIIL